MGAPQTSRDLVPGLPENDRVKTIGTQGKRVWLYPKWFWGRLLGYRTAAHILLFALLLIGPWIDVGGHPAMRIDLVDRRIYFWGLTLFATDGYYLLFFLGTALFSLFMFTALFGRAWCGWACPQSVFLESVIRPIERLLEGNTTQRRRLDKAPWTPGKVARKLGKWGAFLVVAGAIGTTVVAYFLGREGIIAAQQDPFLHPTGTLFFLGITAIAMFDFVWFREQTCVVVCPYGRWQSVMLDADSLTVGYDVARGEPRGKLKDPDAGDCVDCRRCVNVCPTGIDIRKGAQMECVQCMACIDACDDMMQKVRRPQGLVRLTSERGLAGKKTRVLRPRVAVYAVALVAVWVAFTLTVRARQPVDLNLVRQAGAPYAELPDGRLQNSLRLRVSNRTSDVRQFELELVSPVEGELLVPTAPFEVPGEQVRHVPMFLLQSRELDARTFEIRVRDDHGYEELLEFEFMTGSRTGRAGGGAG